MRITVPNPLGPPITIDTSLLKLSLPTLVYRRPTRYLTLIFVLFLLFTFHIRPPLPPSYGDEWHWEKLRDRTEGQGRDGRYVRFDTPKASGFNHQLQRVLLHHHMAVLGNRSLAYEPFVQDETWLPFKLGRWPWRSAEIPLSAFIGNVISGFEKFSHAPKAVSDKYFWSVCPGYRQTTFTLRSEDHPEGDLELVKDGQARVHQLQVMLAGSDVNCLRIEGNVFDDGFLDSSAPLELYDTFMRSPVIKYFTFSPTVLEIINRLIPDLAPQHSLYNIEKARVATDETPSRSGVWKHVLALHLRRGNGWEAACDDKAIASAPFVAFNKLPRLPGNENIPPSADMVEATRLGLYRAKCFPATLDIIARARRMKKNHPFLTTIYILTDADDAWCAEIAMWLSSEGWNKVWVGKKDVYSDWDDREVGVAVDMEVARRSGVFIGNGFSTTSSNIVLLRQRDAIHPDLTQFW